MKKSYLLIIILALSFLYQSTFAQSADEIIDNYAQAIGGAGKWMSINSLKFTGKAMDGSLELPITITVKRDGKTRMEVTYQGMSLIRASDGTTGWTINPFQTKKEAEKLPAEEFKEVKKFSEIEGELIHHKDKGYQIEFLGKDDFEGSEVYKLKLTDKDGDKTYYFLDATSYLPLMKSTKRKIKEKEIKERTVYGNYQNINGLLFPMTIETIEGEATSGRVMMIENIEENVPADDSLFIMPKY